MAIDWIDASKVEANALLLLEREQVGWLLGMADPEDLGAILRAYPHIAWYLTHKCPEHRERVAAIAAGAPPTADGTPALRAREERLFESIADWLVYLLEPESYDEQPFTGWDTGELLRLADFSGKTTLDVGAGTGRLALSVADRAAATYCVEPVENLRAYIARKAAAGGLRNVYCVDGLITRIPFHDGFSDITMAGHVFGDDPEAEHAELTRVTKKGGLVILCPGNNDVDNEAHRFLVARGYAWSRFEEPEVGMKRKYWLRRG